MASGNHGQGGRPQPDGHDGQDLHVDPHPNATIVQTIKIFSNWNSPLDGSLALMEDKLKEQVAGLELAMMFVLCDNSALHIYIPNIACWPQAGTDVSQDGHHQLETSISFLQIKSSMGMYETSR
jgi:hypothetical protein